MTFRNLLRSAREAGTTILLPGASDGITARLIEDVGFPAVYVTGAGLANSRFAYPDVGLITLSELVDHVAALSEAVAIPVVVDADTGFGGVLNVQRTVRLLERAGASAIQLEDQVLTKRCGHFDGHQLVATEEMVQKIRAAVDVRQPDTVIIARTDGRSVGGVEEALRRATAYREAGADVLFVEAPQSRDELRRIPSEVPGIYMVNMVEGGKTPLCREDELRRWGYTVVLYANTALRASLFAARRALDHLFHVGDTAAIEDDLISWGERQGLVRQASFDARKRTLTGH